MAREGIAVPLALSHRLIGELVGARRPTVSSALAELARDRQLVRRNDGTWLLTGEPVTVPDGSAAEVIRQRRRLMPAAAEPTVTEAAHTPRMEELRQALAVARETTHEQARQLGELRSETAALRDRTIELRAERQRRLEQLRDAASSRH